MGLNQKCLPCLILWSDLMDNAYGLILLIDLILKCTLDPNIDDFNWYSKVLMIIISMQLAEKKAI